MLLQAWRPVAAVAALLLLPAVAHAQANLQLWDNVTLGWIESKCLVYELDFEPKVLLDPQDNEPGWDSLDTTANIEYSAKT